MSQQEPDWIEAWENCYDDPLLFVTGVLRLPDKTNGCDMCGAPVIGHGQNARSTCDCPGVEPWQHRALNDIGQGDRVTIRSGHGVGKTTLFAWVAWWFITTRRNCKVPIISNSQDQLRDTIWPELRKWQQRMPPQLAERYEVLGEKVVLKADPDSAFVVARTAPKHNPEALQGFHAENLIELPDGSLVSVANLLVLIDEASGIEEVFFEVSRGALSGKGTKLMMAGNPTRTSGTFYDSHHKLRGLYRTHHVSCLDVPRAQGHVEDIKAQYGEGSNAWRVRVLGDFPTQDDETVIPLEWCQSAVGRDVGPDKPYYPVWGLDVARYGDDSCALAKRLDNKLLEPVKTWAKKDGMETAGKVKAEYENTHPDYQPKEIVVDAAGMGSILYDRMREIGLPVVDINVGERPASDERCMRMRDELWWAGRTWLESRRVLLPEDDELIADLTAPLYTFTSSGKIVVEPKTEMKKRGLRSPDRADAFLLTFAGGLNKKIDPHRRRKPKPRSAWAS